MAYLALARKWRPQTFEAITGQEHVTRTLMNAITQDRVHHAFLFCGARGVGKTTAARVLARALNCDKGPTTAPCGECRPCQEIAASASIDVLEIDGASNRGIGEIRELREGVAYAPQRDRTKIYIIDEVHMLTTEAFNALLKTLEEPPSHVKFIFATTEPQKIPVTILSRCQRFDFKRIGQEQMLQTLGTILEAEGVSIDEVGMRLIARESEGSMRDALSLLDRIISFCGKEATGDAISKALGVADRRWMDSLIDAALAHDSATALGVVADVFEYGTDLRHFTRDLLRSLRDLVILRVAPESPELLDLTDAEREAHKVRLADHSPQRLQRLFQLVLDASERITHSSFPRLDLEMAVVRMCHARPLRDLDGLVQRLSALERRLGAAPPASSDDPGEEKKRPFEPEAPPENLAPPSLEPVPMEPPRVLEQEMAPKPAEVPEPVQQESSEPAVTPSVPVPEAALPEAPVETAVPAFHASEAKRSISQSARPAPDLFAKGSDVATMDHEGWDAFVDRLQHRSIPWAASLEHAEFQRVEEGKVVIAFERGSANGSRIQKHGQELLKFLKQDLSNVGSLGIDEVESVENCPHRRRMSRVRLELDRRRQAIEENQAVAQLVERFDGSLAQLRVFGEEELDEH